MGGLAGLGFWLARAQAPAPPGPQSPATSPPAGGAQGWVFTLRESGQVRARFGGATAAPLGTNRFDVRQLAVDTFSAAGEADLSATAPRCEVTLAGGGFVAQSPGEIRIVQADGRFTLQGQGFHWDHGAQRLALSNRVRARVQLTLPNPDPPR
ncbi:MAG: hypothetical protein ACKO3N_00020 [Verrucomicrobiota bacterium]